MITWVNKRFLGVLTGSVLAHVCLLHADLVPLERAFTVQRWTTDDGLPGNSIKDLGYGPDGLLWGVSGSGIWRFDGTRFVTTPAALTDHPDKGKGIRALKKTPEGGIFLQIEESGIWFKNGKWERCRYSGEVNYGNLVMSFATPNDVWSVTPVGLLRQTGGKQTFFPGPAEIINASGQFTWASADSTGSNVWLAAKQGLYRYSNGHFTPVEVTATREVNFERVCVGSSGQVWLYGHPDRFYVLRDGVWETLPKPVGEWPVRMGVEVMAERNGKELWVGTADGLFQWDGHAWAHLEPGGIAPSGVIALHVGQTGEVWAGLEGGGLLCLRERRILMVRTPDGPATQSFSAVYERQDGLLYAGIANAGLWSGPVNKLARMVIPKLYNKATVLAIAEDGPGSLLIGPSGGSLLWYRERSTELIFPGKNVPWMDFGIRSLLVEPAGRTWVGTQRGLMFKRPQETELNWASRVEVAEQYAVNALARTPDGVVWAASDRFGVIAVTPDGPNTFNTKPERLAPFADVRALHVDSKGRLWAGGPQGLSCRSEDGVWKSFEDMRFDTVVQILEDDSGVLWLGTLNGIARFDPSAGFPKLIWYGHADGLDSVICSGGFGNAGCRMRDGRLLFPTQDGLAVIDPKRMVPTDNPVEPLLDEVLADECVVWQKSPFGNLHSGIPPVLTMPVGARVVKIRYLASNTVAGGTVLFRHRLGDEPAVWSPWTESRAAVFEKLPPANYPFRLQVMRRDGKVTDLVRAPVLCIQPLWWQRKSVQAAGVALLLMALGTGVWRLSRRRMRHRIEQLERERALEAERSRISRELHDDVGASLTQIAMMSQGLKQNIGSSEGGVAEQLEKIFQKARGVTRSLNEIVWSLNPKNDRLENMLVYFSSYAREFLSLADIRCRIHLPDADMEHIVPSSIRHHLYLALKESLHNIVKHAEAHEVWIRVALEGAQLVMEISDDGKGLKLADKVAVDADGQDNLTWRMAQIGGACRQITSEQDGLKTVLSVPLGTSAIE